MIDKTKFQVEVLKDMLSLNSRMRRVEISDEDIGITNGYYIIVLPKSSLKIKYEQLPEVNYDISEIEKEIPQVFDSNVRKLDGNGRTLVKLWSRDKSVISIVNQKYISQFSGFDLFSKGGTSPVYAYDGIGQLTGIILPIRGPEF